MTIPASQPATTNAPFGAFLLSRQRRLSAGSYLGCPLEASASPGGVGRLLPSIGALVLRHTHAKSLTEFTRYADDLDGFAALLGVHLWSKQQEAWRAVHDHRLHQQPLHPLLSDYMHGDHVLLPLQRWRSDAHPT